MGVFSILWSFRELITLVVVSLILAWLAHMVYANIHYHYTELPALLIIEKKHHADDLATWEQQVKDKQHELDLAKAEKERIVALNVKQFKGMQAELAKNRKENEDAKVTGTVSLPSNVVVLYNHAVKGSRIATGQRDVPVPEGEPGVTGETTTLDAATFARIVNGNVLEYNDLALRCGKLMDTVEELERSNDSNINP